MRRARKLVCRRDADVILGAEALHHAKVITWADDRKGGMERPGGQCSCCGLSPRIDGLGDWWLVFRAGLVDGDGVYYAMLCDNPTHDGCLSEIRRENERRERTARDEAAAIVDGLMGDDVDGAEAFMDDLEFLGGLGD